jgi:hypothetical protein
MKREERMAQNEVIAREINEGIERGQRAGEDDEYVRMLCECGRASCDRLIAISISEYENVRGDATHFAVLSTHVEPDIEDVVSWTDRYAVVAKKPGDPAAIARDADPRAD